MSEKCLSKLPVGHFIRFEHVRSMDDRLVYCVIWAFSDKNWGLRTAAFDAQTGEYMGDQ